MPRHQLQEGQTECCGMPLVPSGECPAEVRIWAFSALEPSIDPVECKNALDQHPDDPHYGVVIINGIRYGVEWS